MSKYTGRLMMISTFLLMLAVTYIVARHTQAKRRRAWYLDAKPRGDIVILMGQSKNGLYWAEWSDRPGKFGVGQSYDEAVKNLEEIQRNAVWCHHRDDCSVLDPVRSSLHRWLFLSRCWRLVASPMTPEEIRKLASEPDDPSKRKIPHAEWKDNWSNRLRNILLGEIAAQLAELNQRLPEKM